jgi:prevent-host-death family protein
MCYHVLHHGGKGVKKGASSQQVGVRELRQHLSRYLRRISSGERFEVTERGRPVAILAPLPGHASAVERLTAANRLVPARLDLLSLGLPPELPRQISISEALVEQRRER